MTDKSTKQQTSIIVRGTSDANFVSPATTSIAPAPAPTMPVKPVLAPIVENLPTLAQSTTHDASDEVTRARGFVLRTGPLAFAFAVFVGALIWLGGGAWWALPAAFAVFAVVWGIAFFVHLQRSPAGIAWFQTVRIMRMLEREQDYLHRVDWYERTKDKRS